MSIRTNSSRERILSSAESIILQKGFTATSIEDILKKASITKGGFFYHFEGKSGLAEALIDRYLEQDAALFESLFEKARDLSEDPLHQLLIFLKLLAEKMGQMEQTHPGCLVATFTYENQQFKDEIRKKIVLGYESWRDMITQQLTKIDEKYSKQTKASNESLANMFISAVEGGILLTRAFMDNELLVGQILAYRTFLRSIYGVE